MQCAIRLVPQQIGGKRGPCKRSKQVRAARVSAAAITKDTEGERRRKMVNLGTALLTGGGFGFLLDRAKTDVPLAITEQMAMHHFTMMRMFLGASATSLLVMALLHATGVKERVPRGGLALGLGKCGGYGANVLGGTLLGSGMALTGSCPGTVWAQVGAGLPYVVHIIAGGMLATLVVGYLEKGLLEKLPNYQKRGEPKALDQMLKIPYPAVAVGMAVMMVAVIKVVEVYFPWKVSSALWVAPGAPLASFPPTLHSAAWDPLIAGVLLGLLQIPAILTNGTGLGASAGWVFAAGMAAKTCDHKCEENAPYFTRTRSIWQAVAALGMVCGGFISNYYARASVVGPVLSAKAAVGVGSAVSAFCGGFLLLLGSRIANGCTSGHGLTGMATLSISSFITVACMFAGGILTKLLL